MDAACTCRSSLTRSMGATAVLEIAAAMPPAAKSFKKLVGSKGAMVPVLCYASFYQRDPRGERDRRCSAARDLTNTSHPDQSQPAHRTTSLLRHVLCTLYCGKMYCRSLQQTTHTEKTYSAYICATPHGMVMTGGDNNESMLLSCHYISPNMHTNQLLIAS